MIRLRRQEYLQSLWICHSIHHPFLKTILVSFNRINFPLNQHALQDPLHLEPCWIWTAQPQMDTTDHVHHPLFLVGAAHPIRWEVEAVAEEEEVGNKATLH